MMSFFFRELLCWSFSREVVMKVADKVIVVTGAGSGMGRVSHDVGLNPA